MPALQLPLRFSTPHRRPWQLDARTLLAIAGSIVVVAAIAAWALLLRPQSLGGPAAHVMVSGMSMEPTLHNGDLVVAHRRSSYRIGDVVAYRVPKGDIGAGSLIIHRIVGGSAAAGWIVQGDNKDVPDLWRPRSTDVVGAMWVRVPSAGSMLARATSPVVLGLIAVLFALFLRLPTAVANAADSGLWRRSRVIDHH